MGRRPTFSSLPELLISVDPQSRTELSIPVAVRRTEIGYAPAGFSRLGIDLTLLQPHA